MIVLVIVKKSNVKLNCKAISFKKFCNNVFYSSENNSKDELIKVSDHKITLTNSLVKDACIKEIEKSFFGEFSYGTYDCIKKEFFGRRDVLGVKPFYYHDSEDFFIYSTSLKKVKCFLQNTTVNQSGMVKTLSNIPPSLEETFYNEIKQLAPAHKLSLINNNLKLEKYWEFSKSRISSLDEYLSKFDKSIKKRLRSRNGSELSGGLDSSGIVSKVRGMNPEKELEVFRHVMGNSLNKSFYPFCDERKFSNLICDSNKNIIVNNITSKDKGILKELSNVMRVIGSPFFSTIALFSDELYEEAAKKNVDVLFSGFGGDEAVSSSANFFLIELANEGKWLELKKLLDVGWLSSKLVKLYLKTKFPFLKSYRWQKEQFGNSLLKKQYIKEFDIKKHFWKHHKQFEAKTLNESIIKRLKNPTLNTRITENGQILRAKGIEYTFPLLDVDLIETYLGLPSEVKYNKELPRWPFRQAIKPYVPKEIYLRQDKTGATIPTVFYRFMNDYENIEAFLEKHKNGKASEFLNIPKMQKILPLIKAKAEGKKVKKRLDLRIFIIGLQMILYFDEGVLDKV